MKKFIFILFVFASYCADCQVKQDAEASMGGYGGAIITCRPVGEKIGFFTTGVGGVLINNHRLGFFFSGLTNRYSDIDKNKKSFKFSCYFGGVSYGYPFYNAEDWHLIADIRLGYGATQMINTDWHNIKVANFIGITPSLGIGYLLTDFLLVSCGFDYNYFYFHKIKYDYNVGNEFNKPGCFVSLKIGQYR